MRHAIACLFAITTTVSMLAAPSADVFEVREWRAKNERQILAELIQLVSLPNIAANKADILKNADALTAMFEKRGFAVTRIETPGSPGGRRRARRRRPRRAPLTFYMHYDGQPTDAKDWTHRRSRSRRRPSKAHARRPASRQRPDRSGLRIYGRAVSDDKGPIVAFLAAVDGLLDANATLPWNLRVVLDGEEEAGSPNFTAAMIANAASVFAATSLWSSTARAIRAACRRCSTAAAALTGAEITIYGATGDLHSGNYGNFVPDPAMALAKLLASMKDDKRQRRDQEFLRRRGAADGDRAPRHRRDSECRSEAARAVRR